MKHVLIVEDHPLVNLGISLIVQDYLPDCITHQTSSVAEALAVLNEQEMDLVILDVNIPGGGSTRMIGQLRSQQCSLSILVSTGINEKHNAIDFLRAGANGFVSKNAAEEEYCYAIRTVLDGRTYISDAVQKMILSNLLGDDFKPVRYEDLLTPLELEVMQLMLQGKRIKEISTKLRLKLSTVSAHKKRVFNKMRADNLIDLLAYVNKSMSMQ